MWVFRDFAGVNNTAPPFALADNELLNAVNLYVTHNGQLRTRGGFELVAVTQTPVLSISQVANTLYVMLADGTVRRVNADGTLTQITTHNATTSGYLLSWDNLLFIVDGGPLRYYDSVANSVVTVNNIIFKTEVAGVGDGTQSSFSYTTRYSPVTPQSVTVTAGSITANDDGQGNITGNGVAGSINYNTGQLNITFSTPPANGVQVTVKYSTSDVLNVTASLIAVKQPDIICVADGDSIYYTTVARDLTRWSKVVIDSKRGGVITAIVPVFSDLIVAKTQGIYRLSGIGYNISVSMIAKNMTIQQKSCIHFLSDLLFVYKRGLYALSTVREYGDFKAVAINSKFSFPDTDYILFTLDDDVFCGVSNNISWFCTPVRNYAFTYFNTSLQINCVYNDGVNIYIGTTDGVYRYNKTKTTDDDFTNGTHSISYFVYFKPLGDGFNRIITTRYITEVSVLSPCSITLWVIRNDAPLQVNNIGVQSGGIWDILQWDQSTWTAGGVIRKAKRQIISGVSLQFMLTLSGGLAEVSYLSIEGGMVNA